jgi:hypothetical protein
MGRMEVAVSRAALVLAPGEQQKVLPFTQPINDLIGLRDGDDPEYRDHLIAAYREFWPDEWYEYDAETAEWLGLLDPGLEVVESEARETGLRRAVDEAIYEWQNGGVPGLFLETAQLAEAGRFSARLASVYERIQLRPGDEPDAVPDGDLPALAAWGLREAMRVRELELRECPRCGMPWVTAAGQPNPNPYCLRPSPGHHTTCRELDAKARSTERHAAWQREYKRVYARRLRDKLSDEEWAAWRGENSRDGWTRLEDWQRNRQVRVASIGVREVRLMRRLSTESDPAKDAREAVTSGRPTPGGDPDARQA